MRGAALSTGPDRRPLLDLTAALLIVVGGGLSVLIPYQGNHHELIPLVAGLALLLVVHAKEHPIKIAYLALLLLAMRIYIFGDERNEGWELVLGDYILVVISFAASYRLSSGFWKLFFPILSSCLPVAALATVLIHGWKSENLSYSIGDLSVNQTSFLFGTCLTISLCYLWNSIVAAWSSRRCPIQGLGWLAVSGMNAVLLLLTNSRSGLGIPIVSFFVVLSLGNGRRFIRSFSDWIEHRFSLRTTRKTKVSLLLIILALVLSLTANAVWRIYSIPENQLSDLNRLYLLRCYFGTLFSGSNRFIYGMGFTNASNYQCQDAGIIEGIVHTHAHNIFAQLAADNGFFAMLMAVIIVILLARTGIKRLSKIGYSQVFSSIAVALYCLLFLQVEGGWGKVSLLQTLIGISIGSLTMKYPASLEATSSKSA